MHIDFLIDIFKKNLEKNSIVWKNNTFSYKWLLKEYEFWIDTIDNLKLKNGSTVVIESEISPRSLALLLALIENNCIVIPLTDSVRNKKNEFLKLLVLNLPSNLIKMTITNSEKFLKKKR